jgi:hypothetical protein
MAAFIRCWIIALALSAITAELRAANEDEPTPDFLAPGEWPTTVDGVVEDIVSRMPERDRTRIRDTNLGDLIKFHHGFGTWIRNNYGLWRGNQTLIVDACGQPCHPDDASMKIIYALWHALQAQE